MRLAASVTALSLLCGPLFAATARRLDGGPQPIVVRPAERNVTIDVKDAEAVEILRSMQKQCGIRNLMIDPQVKGKGTFYFREVPCRQAWNIVLRTLGFEAAVYTNSIVAVSPNKR